jgi:hypothetical protein
MHYRQESVIETGNAWVLGMVVPFITLGSVLLLVAIVAIVALR